MIQVYFLFIILFTITAQSLQILPTNGHIKGSFCVTKNQIIILLSIVIKLVFMLKKLFSLKVVNIFHLILGTTVQKDENIFTI